MVILTPKEVATLLDGEGYIGSEGSQTVPSPRVAVGMTDPTYPKALHEQFGGTLLLHKNTNPKHKDDWRWCVNSRMCEPILMYALPELKMKKAQAEAVLLMVIVIGVAGTRSSDKSKLLRWKLHEILRTLNKKGKRELVDEVIESLEEKL